MPARSKPTSSPVLLAPTRHAASKNGREPTSLRCGGTLLPPMWPLRSSPTDLCWAQAKLLCRPLGVPSVWRHWQQRHFAQRWAGCADLPAVRSTHVRTVPIRAMSTTASPPKAKSQKTKNRDKSKDDSKSLLAYAILPKIPAEFYSGYSACRSLQGHCQPSTDKLQYARQLCAA